MANWTEGTKTYIAQGNTLGWKRGTHQRHTQLQRGATSQARVCGMVFEWTKIKNQPLIFQIQLRFFNNNTPPPKHRHLYDVRKVPHTLV